MEPITRVSVDMPVALHKLIKHIAVERETTVREVMLEAARSYAAKPPKKKPRKKALRGAALTLKTIEDSKKGIGLIKHKSFDDFVAYLERL